MRRAVLVGAMCGAALICGGAAIPARADLLRELRSGPWSGGAYSLDGTRKFNACVVSVNYRSGINVGIIVDRRFNWSLGFSNPSWNVITGQDIPVSMTFDSSTPWNGKARGSIIIPLRSLWMIMRDLLIHSVKA